MSCQVPWGFGHQVMYLFFIFRHFMYVNNLMYITKVRDFGNKTVLVETIIVYGGLMKMKRSLNINQF